MPRVACIDPIRRAWESSNFEEAIVLMNDGVLPSAATYRRIFSPSNLWRALNSTHRAMFGRGAKKLSPDRFARALLTAAMHAPAILALRCDILGDMLSNQSLRLLLSCICSQPGRFFIDFSDPIDSGLLTNAASAILAIDPSWSRQPSISCSWSSTGTGAVAIHETSELLWTKSPYLPERLAKMLLETALGQEKILPAQAWSCAREAIDRGRCIYPASLMRVLELSAGDAMANADKACAQIALRAYNHTWSPGEISDWIAITARIATLKSLSGANIHAQSLLGSAPPSALGERHGTAPYSIAHLQNFDPKSFSSRRNPESLHSRANAFLSWLEGSALICAQSPVEPMGWPLENPRLQAMYESLSSCALQFPNIANSPFPIGAPTLREAFDSRVLELALRNGPAGNGLPSLRKTL